MTEAPILLFGVGSTKSGTTWLYRYLADHPECRVRSVKELHYFDGIDLNSGDWYGRQLRDRRAALSAKLDAAGAEKRENLRAQIADVDALLAIWPPSDKGVPEYLRYLFEGTGGRKVVADVTPAYGLLSAERLKAMAGLARDVRFVYLMRDPVARLWSHVRMLAARSVRLGQNVAQTANDLMARLLSDGDEAVTSRGDYRGALGRLAEAVPAERLFVEFTERLVAAGGARRLCDFLGIGHRDPQFQRVHEGVPATLSPTHRQAALALLRPQYDYVARTFGPLPREWQASLAGA